MDFCQHPASNPVSPPNKQSGPFNALLLPPVV